jgi:hypothetical protein
MQTDGNDPEIWSRPCPNCGSQVELEWAKFYAPRCAQCGISLKPAYTAWRGLAIYFAFGPYAALLYMHLANSSASMFRTIIFAAGCVGAGVLFAAVSAFCVSGLALADERPWRAQFSLLQAMYAMIFGAVVLASFLRRDYPRILTAGYFLWGLIEFARYAFLKARARRANDGNDALDDKAGS